MVYHIIPAYSYCLNLSCMTVVYISETWTWRWRQPDAFKTSTFTVRLTDGARLPSLEDINLHCHNVKHDKRCLKMICGECGAFYSNMQDLTKHIKHRGLKLPEIKIEILRQGHFQSKFQLSNCKGRWENHSDATTPSNCGGSKTSRLIQATEKAAAATKSNPVRDDITPAFDTHYLMPAVSARYQLEILNQTRPEDVVASPEFPTMYELHTFRKPPGLQLPKIPLTHTPLHLISSTDTLVKLQEINEIPETQQNSDNSPTLDVQPEVTIPPPPARSHILPQNQQLTPRKFLFWHWLPPFMKLSQSQPHQVPPHPHHNTQQLQLPSLTLHSITCHLTSTIY